MDWSTIGYHCSHEQYSPTQLLANAKMAADAGFGLGMCSDHFHPWSDRQAQSGAAWPWLGAALAATRMSFGTVCAPGQRYHPAIIAQFTATLADMFSGRFWLAVGTGEALNEAITGCEWPTKEMRKLRLRECVDVMRSLWAGATVTHEGLITVKAAKLYSRPLRPPALFAACLTPQSAEWAASWADGLITVAQQRTQLKEVVDAFEAGGGAGKPKYLQVTLSYAESEELAIRNAMDQWRQAGLAKDQLAELDSPAAFDNASKEINIEKLRQSVRISANVEQHLEWLQEDLELGFDQLYLHNVTRNQEQFIREFARHIS